jgi:hypothetical protein
MKSQCLINTTNFIKTKNHFNYFKNIFACFSTQLCTFFCRKYTLESHNISWKKIFFWLNSLCYGLPYYAKSMEKHAPKLPRLKFKHGHPWKIVQCDNIFGHPIMCFHLSQLEATTLPRSTSKRSITTLIVSWKYMSKRSKNIINLEQEAHHPKAWRRRSSWLC